MSQDAANSPSELVIDVRQLYGETAKLAELPEYLEKVRALAGQGNIVIVTGQGPVWLYLKIGHALHGLCRRLTYRSPASGDVLIFNHDPF